MPEKINLSGDEIHVWYASLPIDAQRYRDLQSILSPEEHEQAERFIHDRDRERFRMAHVILREVLARYIETPAADIEFQEGERGKPFFADRHATSLQFNLAHSGEAVVVAVTENDAIGVDIERKRDKVDCMNLAKRFFAPAEYRQLSELSETHRRDAFFRCWALKEAYIKAIGSGLYQALDSFVVDIADQNVTQNWLLQVDQPQIHDRCTLRLLDLHPDYTSAFAVMRSSARVITKTW